MGLTVYQQLMSCLERVSHIMEMEEFVFDRNINVENKSEVELKYENADIGWGFRVK